MSRSLCVRACCLPTNPNRLLDSCVPDANVRWLSTDNEVSVTELWNTKSQGRHDIWTKRKSRFVFYTPAAVALHLIMSVLLISVKQWGHIIVSKRHFIESLFRGNLILSNRFAERKYHRMSTSYCRTTFLRNFQRNAIFPKICLAERHFHESLLSRTSFSRNIICPNIIFPKSCVAGRHFIEHYVIETSVRWNLRKRHSLE